MPKIVRLHSIGGPEHLKIDEIESRKPGEGEVKLRVQSVGLNRAELYFMRGYYFEKPEPPSQIGSEASGIVEEVGTHVDSSWVGKHVSTVPGFSMVKNGVLGEEAIVHATALSEYPTNLSPEEAAAIWMPYLTSYGGLVKVAGVKPGDFVLITAASSSVGLAAIQIANEEGAIPIAATRRSAKRDELLRLGAKHVIATEEQDLPNRVSEITQGKGARVIFDPVAGPGLEVLAQAAALGGTILEYGALSPESTPFPLLTSLPKALGFRAYSVREISRDSQLFSRAKQYVLDRLYDGRFRPKIARTFALSNAAEAYRYLESNEQVGKVVIKI